MKSSFIAPKNNSPHRIYETCFSMLLNPPKLSLLDSNSNTRLWDSLREWAASKTQMASLGCGELRLVSPTLRIKRSDIDIFKTNQSYIGTEAISTVKSIKLLQQVFQKRFIDTSSLNKLKNSVIFELENSLLNSHNPWKIFMKLDPKPFEPLLQQKIRLEKKLKN